MLCFGWVSAGVLAAVCVSVLGFRALKMHCTGFGSGFRVFGFAVYDLIFIPEDGFLGSFMPTKIQLSRQT